MLIKAKDVAERLQILLEEGRSCIIRILGVSECNPGRYASLLYPLPGKPQTSLNPLIVEPYRTWHLIFHHTIIFSHYDFYKKKTAKRFFISSIFPLIKKLGLKILSQARGSSTVDGGEVISEIEALNTMYTLNHVK